MAAPITTKGADIDVYDILGNPAVIPWLGLGDTDAAGTWFYMPDKYLNQPGLSSRILRVNANSNAVEEWKASGDLPANVNSLCFNHAYTKLYCTTDTGTSVWEVDFATKAVTEITGLSAQLSALIRLPASGEFIGWDETVISLRKITLPTLTDTANWIRCKRWTIRPVVAVNGDIYRAYQVGGPNTNGPIFHYRASHIPITVFDASWTHNGTSTNGVAYESRINATGLAVNDDSSVIYFTDDGDLKKVYAGVVDSIGTVGSGNPTIIAMSRPLNKCLTMRARYFLNVWS